MKFSKYFFAQFIRKIYYKYISKTTIHTVVLRGRLDSQQADFVKKHSNFYGKSWKQVLRNMKNREVVLEVGFGDGSHLLTQAKQNSDKVYVGVELDEICIFKTLKKVDQENLKNIFILNVDARALLDQIQNNFFNKIYVLFPDPWPKKKYFKHRLLSLEFIKILISKINEKGEVMLATDVASYAKQVHDQLVQLQNEGALSFQTCDKNNLSNGSRFAALYNTKFAERAKKEGREITIFSVSKLMV